VTNLFRLTADKFYNYVSLKKIFLKKFSVFFCPTVYVIIYEV